MKYLLVLAVIVLVLLWLTRSRASASKARSDQAAAPRSPEAMVSCAHCGVHLPRGDAVTGAQGLYCSEAHRLARGDGR